MTAPGQTWYEYRDGIDDALQIYTDARNYHWTPEQSRSIDHRDRMIYMALSAGENRAEKEKASLKK